jgi:rubredoxin
MKISVFKCPKCGEEIDHLINRQTGWMDYTFSLDMGEPHYAVNGDGFHDDADLNIWVCPWCDKKLFDDEDSAFEFLGGKYD